MEDDYHVPGDIQMKRGKIPIFSPDVYHEEIEMQKCTEGCSVLYSDKVTNRLEEEDVKNS